MSATSLVVAIACALLLVPLPAQDHDELPTEHVLIIPPGGFIDLDTGLILPSREHRAVKADLRFDRDGAGFFLEPLFGGLPAQAREVTPAGEWAPDRFRLERQATGAAMMFVRTDHGVARVELLVADPYSTASAVLRWVLVPPKQPVFLPPPEDLAANWVQQKLEVTWTGEHPRWLIEVHTDGKVRKETAGECRIVLDGLAVQGQHRILVRGLTAANEVSLPGEVIQHGARRPAERGVLEFADRWYDSVGGMKLSDGTIATEDAEVVFYLYGVSVPGGGVLKMGSGAGAYAALSELPAGGYSPVYGRIDDNDVLAVRLRDGRYGKLWLEPNQNSDVRSGMSVHFAFLADGRRRLLPPPSAAVAETMATGVSLQWQASPGAVSYRVTVPGRAEVLTVTQPQALLQGLAQNRLFDCELVAVGEDGAISDVGRATLHTYGPEVKLGRGTIQAQRGGFVFASGQAVKDAKDSDLAITGGAGGASFLQFAASNGAAPGGAFAFGEFPGAQLTFNAELGSDDREKDSDRFYVRTADGGFASVRIVERGWPDTVIEYVWRPKR